MAQVLAACNPARRTRNSRRDGRRPAKSCHEARRSAQTKTAFRYARKAVFTSSPETCPGLSRIDQTAGLAAFSTTEVTRALIGAKVSVATLVPSSPSLVELATSLSKLA